MCKLGLRDGLVQQPVCFMGQFELIAQMLQRMKLAYAITSLIEPD